MMKHGLAKVALLLLLLGGMLQNARTSAQSVREQYQRSPGDPALRAAMLGEWMKMATGKQQAEVLEETERPLARTSDSKYQQDLRFVRARAGILIPGGPGERAAKLVEEFVSTAPTDDRSAELLFRLAKAQPNPAAASPIFQRAADTYPTSYWGIMSKGNLTQIAGLGKTFDLQFKDAISGRDVSVQTDMKGKVVVVYFWATWCSDCTAELPAMKQLYTKYKDRGVEFVGVSLDEPEAAGGLRNLKSYVAENSIPWPQYFQGGQRMNSEFSSKWGVSATPTVFVLNRSGQLHSTTAKGKVEQVILETLN